MFIKNKILKLSVILVIFIVWAKASYSLDPDFGWHLRAGQLVLENGIQYKDPFSYTMPSYPYADHEWLTNILIAKVYSLTGFIGLGLIFALMTVLALLIQIKKYSHFIVVPFILSSLVLVSFAGIRPQIITWVFFSILIRVILDEKLWRKFKFYFPFLFLIWANLHGGFVIGVIALISKILIITWQKKILIKSNFVILLLAVAITLINPYGFGLWRELWMSLSDNSLRFLIGEWRPALFFINYPIWFYFALSSVLVFRYKKKFTLLEIVFYLEFLLAGMLSIRNMPFWIIISFPLTAKAIYFLYSEIKRYKKSILRFNMLYKLLTGFSVLLMLLSIADTSREIAAWKEEKAYPKKAIEFLIKNDSKGEVFSYYNWGGYLIWKYPSKKVFIDGRMPSWRWNVYSSKESNYAFKDYRKILDGEVRFEEATYKYNIDTVLLPLEKKGTDTLLGKISERINKHFYSKAGGYPSLTKQIELDGWIKIYKDDVSVIYRRYK